MSVSVPTNCIQVSDLITLLQGLSSTALVVVPAPSEMCNPVPDVTAASVQQCNAYYRPKQLNGFGPFEPTQDAQSPQGEVPYAVVVIGPFGGSVIGD